MKMKLLFEGFPGKLNRGFLGWSSITFIQDGNHNILLDAGTYGDRPELLSRLNQIGIKPEDIDTVVLSHFHFDHVINAHLFPKATYLLSKVEAEYVTGGSGDWAVPEYYFEALEKTGRLQLIEPETQVTTGIRTIATPGHTPGLLSLLVEEPGIPTTLIASDAVKNLIELQTGEVPMAWDKKISKRTIENIRDRVERVIPGHDRILHIEKDNIYACHGIQEQIHVPAKIQERPFVLDIPGSRNESCPCCENLIDRRQLD
jgi:N-acyl homoserine lactone hydrolase